MKSILILFAFPLGTACLWAADPPAVATPQPSISFQVLSQVRVTQGDHAVTLQRVAPPALPTSSPASPTPQNPAQTLPAQILSVGATVIDHKFTELRWTSNGKSLHAFSNIDFNLVTVLSRFAGSESHYSFFVFCENISHEDMARKTEGAQAGGLQVQSRPTPDQFPQGQSGFIMAADSDPSAGPADLASMTDLHAYFDAHKAEIQKAFDVRLARQAAHEQWVKDHPPVPQDTVIRYWPVKSKTYLGTGGAGQ